MATAQGTVVVWDDDAGWGAVDSEATPGGCWVHVSAVVAGDRVLVVGDDVRFTFEEAEQDGYHFRAVEAWPADGVPDRSHRVVRTVPGAAYGSMLTLTFDEPQDTED